MGQETRLFELIGEIYDAALVPSLWSDVVGKAGHFVGCPAAAIFSKSPIAGNGNVYYESGIDPYCRELYFEKYVKLDPATTGHYFADLGQPIATADLMPYDEFLETQFYRAQFYSRCRHNGTAFPFFRRGAANCHRRERMA